MGNENKDVIRLFDTEANLISGSTMRPGMLSHATDTNRIVRKRLSDSAFHYWSDDSKQMLLAGAQTVTGNKTYSGTSAFSGAATFSNLLTANNELILGARLDLGAGGSGGSPSSDDVSGYSLIILAPTTLNVDDNYVFTDLSDGQILFVFNNNSSLGAVIQDGLFTITVPTYEMVIMIWDDTISRFLPCGQ